MDTRRWGPPKAVDAGQAQKGGLLKRKSIKRQKRWTKLKSGIYDAVFIVWYIFQRIITEIKSWCIVVAMIMVMLTAMIFVGAVLQILGW